uniref:Focadhesin n=1 Tax=Myripristis murdjan TaxID=586833 RepID=A0A667XYM1_9TELE
CQDDIKKQEPAKHVLKKKNNGPALEALWEQCCSDCAAVRSACCDALVLLVDQGHADLQYVLNSVLNLLPSARNVQGLIKVIGRLLQIQTDQQDRTAPFICPYSIRSSPHPYITALENRVDCWPALLLEIDDFIQQAADRNEPAYVAILVPFLRYLYCEPQRQTQYALLRHSLLRVLLPTHSATGAVSHDKDQDKMSPVSDSLLRCLCCLVPHMQAVLELHSFIDALLQRLCRASGECWRTERVSLVLQLLCACQLCLKFSGDCRPLLYLIQQFLPTCQEVRQQPVASAPGISCCFFVYFSYVSSDDAHLDSEVLCIPLVFSDLTLYLGKEGSPALSYAVLNTLPNYGTHKLCVPQVLQTLQMLGSAPKLKAVAMRLMTTLWKKQDRVYPELQRLLGQQDWKVVVGRDAQWEQILARAACLRDICRERPYQHGGDMLAAITQTLNQCSKPDLATPAALALQGLQELCRAEVVDIVSTWRTLGPKLSCDSRQLMVKTIAELLALVPQLTVKSEDYEVPVLLYESQSPEIREPPEYEEGEEGKEAEDEKDMSIPGSSYVKLMGLTAFPILPAYELFLTSLVRQEMSQMPRGVYFSALRGGSLRSDQGKTVAGIPSFMLKTYEKNKQPGLKPGLAAGLLLCYELPIQTDRDSKPISRFLVSRSRSYQQTLTALIHEVNIQPSEWHRALLLPQAWRGFMSRAFHAVLQGRRADLEMQQKQGKENPEDLQYKQHCAWLWLVITILCVVFRDSPVVQGNSILALSGLAAVLAKYESNLPADTDGSLGFVPTASWLAMVLDTLLGIISSSYKARGQVFPWFPHRSYSGENTASAIARSCASLALSLLVPVLVVWQRDGVSQVLSTLKAGLPGSASADDSQAVQFHSGLALGMVLSSLHHQRLSKHSLGCFSVEFCHCLPQSSFLSLSTGCVLGLGLVLAALCSSGNVEYRVQITQTLDKLLANLQDSSGHGRMLLEVLAYSVACVGVSAFSGGLIDASKADEIMNTLRTLTEESQQTPGFSLALGLVVHGLSACGHGKAEDIHPRLLAAWIKILLAEVLPQNILSVYCWFHRGLCSVLQLKSQSELSSQQQSRLNEVIRAITQIITFSGAIGLQSNSACLVGHLHLAHMSTSHSHTAVPQDFSYLSEKSVLRSIVDFITEAGKKGPEFAHPALVKTALAPLASVGASFQYPPINWNAILSPLMRLSFGEDVQHQCIVLAACQTQSSQSASLFLGSWLSPPLVHSLSYRTRGHLYETLGLWMKHVAEDKFQVYVESLGLQQFQEDLRAQRLALCQSLLQGLAQAMALPNPPNNCWTILCSTTEKIFTLLPNQIQVQGKDNEVELYVGIAKCLSELSDTEIDRIAQVTEAEMEKTCFVLAYLTSQGRVPLLSLNDVIAAVLRGWPSHRVGWLLLQTFYQCRLAASPNTGVSKRMEWLLELMGHIRNVAYGLDFTSHAPLQATDFLLQIFAGAVVCWADQSMPLLLGIRAQWFPWQPGSKPPALQHSLYGGESLTDLTPPLCMLGLSHSLTKLLAKEPWSSQSQKFIDWLLSIAEAPEQNVSSTSISTAKAALLALRSSAEFKKKGVWTRAYGW